MREIELDNTFTTESVSILSLNVYKNLNLSYFQSANFDSAGAVATGALVEQLAGSTDWTMNPGGVLTIALGPVNSDGYELVTGTLDITSADAVPEPHGC